MIGPMTIGMQELVRWTGGRRPTVSSPGGVAVIVLALVSIIVLSLTTSGDYGATLAVSGDNAAPGIEALVRGDVAGYFSHQPLIGLTTILLRLPFAALAQALGGDDLSVYKLGALACLLPLALGAGWFLGEPAHSTRARLMRALTVGIVVASPLLRNALLMGHPEDVAAAALATAAVLLAMRGHAGWSAVALGLAIGAKEWALIAVLPVMVALPGRRLRIGLLATGLVLLLVALPWVADPAALSRAVHAQRTNYLSPLNPLWPLADQIRILGGRYLTTARMIPWGLSRTGAAVLLSAMAGLFGGVWYAGLRRRRLRCDPICLLAILAAVRCVCDTAGLEYYWLAVLIPVAAWEAAAARAPVLTFVVTGGVWVLYTALGHLPSALVYLAAILAQAALITYLAFGGTRPRLETVGISVVPSVALAE